jgi:hypothetical protein
MEMGQPKKYFITASTRMKTRRLPIQRTAGTLHHRRPLLEAVSSSQHATAHMASSL